MENVGALMLEKCLTNGENKNQQTKKGKEEFEEVLSGLLGLVDVMVINSLPEQQAIAKEISKEAQLQSDDLIGNGAQLLKEVLPLAVQENLTDKVQQTDLSSFSVVKEPLFVDESVAEQSPKAFLDETNDSKRAVLREEQILKKTIIEGEDKFKDEVEFKDEVKFKDLILPKTKLEDRGKFTADLEKVIIKDPLLEQESTIVIQEDEIWQQTVLANTGNKNDINEEEIKLKAEQVPSDLPESVISKLKTFERRDGSKELVVQLDPKDLGKMVVKLTSVKGVVSVKILAHYPVTMDLLENSLNSLRQSFIEQGIRFDRMDVELGGEQLNQSPYQHQEQQTWQQGRTNYLRRIGLETNSYSEDDFEQQTTEDSRWQTGTYDYLV